MATVIKETYYLQENPDTWPNAMQHGVKHFFETNGLLPNCFALPQKIFNLFPKALESWGFKTFSTGMREDFKKKLLEMGEPEEMVDIPFTILISPDGDYRLVVTVSDESDVLQFMLAYIDGTKQNMN